MSYLKTIEYEIIPEESFLVIRNCSGCNRKTHFKNTGKFRVNANGNKLDVWLIYQCEHCKHTFNLTIYERQKAASIPKKEYQSFLDNDEQLAEVYGRNLAFFKKNKAEVDFQNLQYNLVKQQERTEKVECQEQVKIVIHNPCCLKIRPEKQISQVLGMSASHVKKMMEQGEITTETISMQMISFHVKQDVMED
ncbi:MAG: DUF1062 domain-containing protein [Lachnospiraceae bacterium]|nr:DUF1062 domain-containing protein [Lachnospiraceae bacterium]